MHLLREHWACQCKLAADAGDPGPQGSQGRWEIVTLDDDDEDDEDSEEHDEQAANPTWQELDEAEVLLRKARQRVLALRQRLDLPMFCDRGTQTIL